jgi:hypothetical protein
MFATIEEVRQESGFNYETNVSDETIENYLIQANAELLSYVATIYDVKNFTGSLFDNSSAKRFLSRLETLLAS